MEGETMSYSFNPSMDIYFEGNKMNEAEPCSQRVLTLSLRLSVYVPLPCFDYSSVFLCLLEATEITVIFRSLV